MKNKSILLISMNGNQNPSPVYPIALSYLSTYLKDRLPNYNIELIDINLNSKENILDKVDKIAPDYIGISMRNVDNVNLYNYENFTLEYKLIVEAIRKRSRANIVLGGAGFSIYPKLLFEFVNPDFAIKGEGEKSFYQLIYALDNNKEYQHIEGLLYRKDSGEIIENDMVDYLKRLDLKLDDNLVDFYWQNSGMLGIQTKRGCPYNCVYCSYPVIDGRKVRTLDSDKILFTIKELYNKKGIDYFFFTDSIFNIQNEFNLELMEKIIHSNLDIKWGAYFSPKNLNQEFLSIMKRAGLTHIEFGTDSFSNNVLKLNKKHFLFEDILDKSEICNKLGIYFAHFLILCGYGETEETLEESFKNSQYIPNSVFFVFIGMRIFPKTELQKIAIEKSIIDKHDTLLEPKYYISPKDIDIDILKQRAKKTNKKWVFPDDDFSRVMTRMRKKNKKGPLWEFLIK